jgi:phosphonopyruvate decarboxylase
MPSRSAADDRSAPWAGPAMSTRMLCTEAAEILAAARREMLSVVTMQAIRPWKALGQSDLRNFYLQGSIGSAAAIGLDLALAPPEERVLRHRWRRQLAHATGITSVDRGAAARQPCPCRLRDRIYETSGGQSGPGRQVADLASIALTSAYFHARRFSAAEHMRAEAWSFLRLDGPVLVSLDISGPGRPVLPPDFVQPPGADAQVQNIFDALGTGVG